MPGSEISGGTSYQWGFPGVYKSSGIHDVQAAKEGEHVGRGIDRASGSRAAGGGKCQYETRKGGAYFGGGAIGLVTLMACKAAGARMAVVSDLFEKRLEKAKALGADYIFHAGKDVDFMDMCDFTDGEGFDYVFETAGSKVTAAQASYLVRRGGTIVMVGNIVGDVAFNFRNLYLKEADVKTVFVIGINIRWRYRGLHRG